MLRKAAMGVAVVCLTWSAVAGATVLQPLALSELVHRGDRIVQGQVESLEPRYTANGKDIVTEVTVRIKKVYKGPGQAGDTLRFLREGGQVGDVQMQVLGAPHFTRGEEVVVFSEERAGARYVVGMLQGKMALVRRADASVWVSRPELDPALRIQQKSTVRETRWEQFDSELTATVARDLRPPSK